MAKLRKMHICGLRSFGPCEEDIQEVRFTSPVTLFLGPNGSGKTTIIEALKYACSGSLPPISSNGQSFVNDPKICNKSLVRGQVRLKLEDASGDIHVIVKSLQVVQKYNKLQFSKLDSTITTTTRNGISKTISSQCSDIDATLCQIMGVSKPILNNVIFCHQENSLWPLDEPKKLKEKFDEIFGATQYNKSIGGLKKILKEKGRIKLVDLERLLESSDLELNFGKLTEKHAAMDEKINSVRQQQKTILERIETEFEGTDDELQQQIDCFEANRSTYLNRLKQLEKKEESTERKVVEQQKLISKQQVKLGSLEEERKQQQRNQELNQLIQAYTSNIVSNEQQITKIQEKVQTLNDQLHDLDVSDKKLKSPSSQIAKMDKDLETYIECVDPNQSSNSIEETKSKILESERELERLEKEYKILNENSIIESDLETHRDNITKREVDIHKLKNKNFDAFTDIFNKVIPDPGQFKRHIESKKGTAAAEVENITKMINAKDKEATTNQVNIRLEKDKLENAKKELSKWEKRISEFCKGRPFEIMEEELHSTLEQLQKDKGAYGSAKYMYEKFIRDFEKEKPCPVCRTSFENKKTAVNEIIVTLKGQIEDIPNKLVKVDEELKMTHDQYFKLQQLKPDHNKIEESHTKIAQLESHLSNLNDKTDTVTKELSELNKQLCLPQIKLDACNKAIADAIVIDQHQNEISSSKKKIQDLEFQLVTVPSNRSRQQVKVEIESLKTDILNKRRDNETELKELKQFSDRCQYSRETRNKRAEEQLQIQKTMQGRPQLEEQLNELALREEALKVEVKEFQSIVNSLKDELQKADDDKMSTKDKNKKKLDNLRIEINNKEKLVTDNINLQNLVEKYIEKGIEDHANQGFEELSEDNEYNKILEKEITNIRQNIARIKLKLANLDGTFRSLKDNVLLRQKKRGTNLNC